PFRNAFFGLLFTQASLAVLILVAAVTLSTYSSGIEREGEFATIAARGLGARGLVALLLGEGLSVSLVGTLVAVPTVLVFLWAFVRFEDIATPQSLALEFAIGWPAWALLGAALASATGGTLLAGLRLRRMNLPAILKLRGM
ncbi:MAG TPA: FtsX-like permease family protein, partial [Thermoplasmata archaeon]|nr:FtsX-like permease family protein [Thermoplasmata archaeon]